MEIQEKSTAAFVSLVALGAKSDRNDSKIGQNQGFEKNRTKSHPLFLQNSSSMMSVMTEDLFLQFVPASVTLLLLFLVMESHVFLQKF